MAPSVTAETVSVGWPAVCAAVAVLTAARTGTPVSLAELTDGHEPAEVLVGMAILAEAILLVTVPGERGAELLSGLGRAAAFLDARDGAP